MIRWVSSSNLKQVSCPCWLDALGDQFLPLHIDATSPAVRMMQAERGEQPDAKAYKRKGPRIDAGEVLKRETIFGSGVRSYMCATVDHA